MTATALIADDEPLLRERLRSLLARAAGRSWQVVAEARNGREAVELFDQHAPQVVFLDVHMPGLNGIEAARSMARRAQVVFVTAYEQYAVQAFEQGAIDYLVKPFDEAAPGRHGAAPAAAPRAAAPPAAPRRRWRRCSTTLSAELRRARHAARRYLQWIKASVGRACG